jgi:hypothetical protein
MRLAVAAALAVASLAAAAQEIVTIPTRGEVTQSFFVPGMQAKPRAVALVYSGGNGEIRLRMVNGKPQFSPGNFLVRTREEFMRNGVLPLLVDVPSDSSSGVSDVYRRSDAQLADFRAVLAEARRRWPGLPVFVLTTSRSTLSAAFLARTLEREDVAGLVLSSSMVAASRGWETIGRLEPAAVKPRILFVHHRDDGCEATPYREAARLAEGFDLVSVRGGQAAKSGPCAPFSAHGYFGKEEPTVDAIAAWMLGKPFAKEIE